MDPEAGRASYRAAHIPGAVFLDLQRDLSGTPAPERGRHPMPEVAALAALLSGAGIDADHKVVAYDNNNGVAARLWWLLHYLGHDAVAVLDGGWRAWCAANLPVETAVPRSGAATFVPRLRPDRLVTIDEIEASMPLLDAREPARFRGEVEPFEPRAGRIPGARNHFWRLNLDDDERLLEPSMLAARWRASLGSEPDADTVHYCGSGVTACHNALAQVVAGFAFPRVYVGSYSEWCRAAGRPIAMG